MTPYNISIELKAAKIASYAAVPSQEDLMQRLIPSADISIRLETGEYRRVSRDWFGKTIPAVGGYLIELADGSNGYMPGAIFEALFEVEKADTVDVWPPHE